MTETTLTFKASTHQHKKLQVLKDYLKEQGRIAVAFSGGVDSSFLLYVANEVLGQDALAITARSAITPTREKDDAENFCERYGIRQIVFESREMDNAEFIKNPPDRCYVCKVMIFSAIFELAKREGFAAVAEGSNTDDEGDYRPGFKAIKELGAISPLRVAGLSKQDIRDLSHEFGLPTWSKPSCACLASRFAYGTKITLANLDKVDAAEEFLIAQGFEIVRVRLDNNLARIEVAPEKIEQLTSDTTRNAVINKFKELGFNYVLVDLEGYRTGSLNKALSQSELAQGQAQTAN